MTSFPVAMRIVLVIGFMVLLTFASLVPGRSEPGATLFIRLVAKTPTLLQKVLHVCLYGVLVLLLVWTLDSLQSRALQFLIPLFVVLAFGSIMEWCQTKVPGRFGTLSDVVLNAVGAALGLLAAALLF